jgi:hypothetical protein
MDLETFELKMIDGSAKFEAISNHSKISIDHSPKLGVEKTESEDKLDDTTKDKK